MRRRSLRIRPRAASALACAESRGTIDSGESLCDIVVGHYCYVWSTEGQDAGTPKRSLLKVLLLSP